MCKVFPRTLYGFMHVWYHNLNFSFILHFHDLISKIIFYFSTSIPTKKNIIELFTITQQEDKSTRANLQRFNKKMLNVKKLFEPIAIETLINGVYNYFLMGNVIYSLHGRNIVIVKQAIQDYIGMKKAILIK